MKLAPVLLFAILVTTRLPAETWNGNAQITFKGTSTIHDWSGTVAAQPFQSEVTMKEGQPQHVSSTVTVKATEMNTKEAKRDENMRNAMQVTQHPLILGKIDADFTDIAGRGTPSSLPLELRLLGKPQHLTGKISNWKSTGNAASFDLEFPVSLKASGITVPTVLHFIRVGDSITVHAAVVLKKA
jgi:hypothetical protein